MILCAPADAQTKGGSTALVPYTNSYNGRTAQVTGAIIELKAVKVAESRGLTGAAREAFIASSLTAGGIGLAEASRSNARVQNAAFGAAAGGLTGAIAWGGGCVAVAVATTAGFASPLCAIPALIGGIASGVAVGGVMGLFAGGDDTRVTNPGNLTSDANVTGNSVPKTTYQTEYGTAHIATWTPTGDGGELVYQPGFSRSNFVVNRCAIVKEVSVYKEACALNALSNLSTPSHTLLDFGVVGFRDFYVDFAGGNPRKVPQCSSTAPQCYRIYAPNGWTVNNGQGTVLAVSAVSYPAATQVPMRIYQPVSQVGYPLGALADNPALAGKLEVGLSNESLAALGNEIARHMPKGQGGYEYDPTDPITAQDVADALAKSPGLKLTLGDLLRPINPPGQGVQLGSSTKDVTTNPAYVNPVYNTGSNPNPGTGQQTGTSPDNPTYTKEVAPTASEKDGAVAAIMAPLQGLLDSIPKPEWILRDVQCPALSIDMRGPNMQMIGLDFRVDTDFHCVLAEQFRAAIQAFILFAAGLAAWRRAISA
ncbi:hypothetical protein [Sphingomonas sp. DT-204]|uniref:hypothetical protein n=1 Tax=Sphingomonas sp. DT-204 TaxID=3396166 RepID=UPI003F195B02